MPCLRGQDRSEVWHPEDMALGSWYPAKLRSLVGKRNSVA